MGRSVNGVTHDSLSASLRFRCHCSAELLLSLTESAGFLDQLSSMTLLRLYDSKCKATNFIAEGDDEAMS